LREEDFLAGVVGALSCCERPGEAAGGRGSPAAAASKEPPKVARLWSKRNETALGGDDDISPSVSPFFSFSFFFNSSLIVNES
jgi:hypothetical protein